jgi:hypothetical protein
VLQKIYRAAAAAIGPENRPNTKEPAKICPSKRGISDDFPKPVIFAQIEKYYFTNLSHSDIFSKSDG